MSREANSSALPAIAIVGRPNVGKSSLFNAVVGRRLAIVHEQAGVTRDRVMATVVRDGRKFRLIDTGGLGLLAGEKKGGEVWDAAIADQVEAAVDSAEILIFLGDAQAGVTPLDQDIARRLRATGKKVLCAANKCDNDRIADEAAEFSVLGFPRVFPVCCEHRSGINALLDSALSFLPAPPPGQESEDASVVKPLNIAIVGRPNVGKSSLVNALLGEKRMITADVAGTTRDAVDVEFTLRSEGEEFPAVLVDTAGLRKAGKVDDAVEFFSAMRAKSAIDRADIVVFMIEASPDGATAQDRKIGAMIESAGKGLVIAVNKRDLRPEKDAELLKAVDRSLPALSYAPAVLISALKQNRFEELVRTITQVMTNLGSEIPTGVLNRVLADAFENHPPPVVGGAPLKLFYATMTGTRPPRIKMFVNSREHLAPHYLAFLRNRLRDAFELTGVPLILEAVPRPKKVESIKRRMKPKRK
ncbi:MAG: ribosome biogenesis GTPase Der [Lentisphaeria bacterium]|nr:ribosome biogenesis GTPase Der [Lentisphaeria bacterium]